MNGIWSLLGVLVLAYAAIVALAYALQPQFLYLPNLPGRQISDTPASIGLAYEDVHVPTEDGERLHGWFVPAQETRGTLLFFHGNAGNISHRLDSLALFSGLGLSVLIIDYRGYGQSTGKPSEDGTYIDAEAAWEFLIRRGVPPERIVLFGRSLGAPIAAHLASRRNPGGLIVESGFVSAPEMAAKLYPWLPARLLVRFRYATGEYLGARSSPVLIVHSRNDEIIPFGQGRRLFEMASEPKSFLELSGSHNTGFITSGRAYTDGIDAFLTSVLGR